MRRLLAKDDALREKVYVMIGLFCRGAVTARFYDDLLGRYRINPGGVETIKVARSHLKGTVTIQMRDGTEARIPFHKMNAYRLAGIHAKPLCLWCGEHLAAGADISVGDIFTPEIKRRPIKHSAVVCRTAAGTDLIQDMVRLGRLKLEFFGRARYQTAFSKIEEFTNDLRPRYWAAKLTGLNAVGRRRWRVNPLHVLSWTLYFLNYRISRSRRGRRFLYRIPQPLVSLWAILIKILSKL